jgi:hypothetical protein
MAETAGTLLSLIPACLWAIVATGVALGPCRWHWPAAWALIVTGVPVLGWTTWHLGPWVGLALLAGGVSVLRWPVIYLLRRLRSPDPVE